jgi:hypothetical protein
MRRSQALSLSFSSFFTSSAAAPAVRSAVANAANIKSTDQAEPFAIIEILATGVAEFVQIACEHEDIVDITPNPRALNFPPDGFTMRWSRFIHLGRGRGSVPLRLSEMEERHGATRR